MTWQSVTPTKTPTNTSYSSISNLFTATPPRSDPNRVAGVPFTGTGPTNFELQEQQRYQKELAKQNLVNEVIGSQERTNERNKARENEIRGILDEVIGMYREGGTFGKGVEAGLERERTKTLATGGQALISSGLYNTTGLAGLSGKFSEEVAMPTRMKLEDLRMDRLSGALGQKASLIEGITDTQPDYRLLASLMAE